MTRPENTELVETLGEIDLIGPAELDRKTAIAAIIITALFWSVNFGVQTFRSVLDHSDQMGARSLARLIAILVGLVFCYAIHLMIRAMQRRPFWQRAVALVLVIPFAADGCAWATYMSGKWLLATSDAPSPTSSALIQAVLYWVWFLLAWGALYLALRYSMEVQASERRARQIQGLAHRAQMRALHNQINPHFMFNTLNSIAALVMEGDRRASELMITGLADFLRATLALDPLVDIPLSEELRIQKLYLDIEQVRFPDMQVAIRSDAEADATLVPPLILQPIVENAVKFGIAGPNQMTHIDVTAHCDGPELILQVQNEHGRAAAQSGRGLGLGLENVRARLAAHYGTGHFTFIAESVAPHDFRVRMAIPRASSQ